MTGTSPEDEYRYLMSPRAVRERATELLEHARAGALSNWELDEGGLEGVADRVLAVTKERYPDFASVPYHSRFRQFDVGGVQRLAEFERRIARESADERLAARAELVITSVLLDAGAGPTWRFVEANGAAFTRSEGLAVASYHLFMSGALSGSAGTLRADAEGLANFSTEKLERAFQVSSENPLAGAAGRSALLRNLGRVVAGSPQYFGGGAPRLGNLALFLKGSARDGHLPARSVLECVLDALGAIWPGREECAGRNLGDVFRHSRFGLVPLHKLSQWLSYSLIEALEMEGVRVAELDELTGLAEYRNGGLFVDAGVLVAKDSSAAARVHRVDSDFIIEWRSLTVALLDRVAALLRQRLQLSPAELPLARVLEGGTWHAGRAIAKELRKEGGPPIQIESDGTVF